MIIPPHLFIGIENWWHISVSLISFDGETRQIVKLNSLDGQVNTRERLTLIVNVGLTLLHVSEALISMELASVAATDVLFCSGSLDMDLRDGVGVMLANAEVVGVTVADTPVSRRLGTIDVTKVDGRD